MNSILGRHLAIVAIAILWCGCSSTPTKPEKRQATLSGTVIGLYCPGFNGGGAPINPEFGQAATVRAERDGKIVQSVDTDSAGGFHLALETGTYDIITSSAITYPPDTVRGMVIDADTSVEVSMLVLTNDPLNVRVAFHYSLAADSLGQAGEKEVIMALNQLTAADGHPAVLAYPEDGPSGQFWEWSDVDNDMWVSYEIPIDSTRYHVANVWLELHELIRSDQTGQFDPVVVDFAGDPWACLQ